MKRFVLWGLVVSAVVAGVLSYYASPRPDGLERAAEVLSDTDQSASSDVLPAPMPDYAVPGIHNARLSGGLAGVIGVAATFIVCFLVGKLVSRRSRAADGDRE